MFRQLFTTLSVFLIVLMIPTTSSFAYDCGDVNCSGGESDISDIVRLIDYLYLSKDSLCFSLVADVNNSGGEPDISDIVRLIDFLYLTHNPLDCPKFKLSNKTIIIPPEDTTAIKSYNVNGTLVLDDSSIYAQEVIINDIIIGQDYLDATNGFLRKVNQKSLQGDVVILETSPATLMEAFEMMSISENYILQPYDLVSCNLYQGTAFIPNKNAETFNIELDVILYDHDGNSETTNDQIKLIGSYSFTASLFANIEIDKFVLKEFELGIETNEVSNLNILASIQYQFGSELEIDLAKFYLGAIPIGGVVWLVPTLTVEAHIHGDLSVTITTGISYTNQLRYGFGYENNMFYNISQGTKDFTYTPPNLKGEFNFEPGISLNASCLLYGVAGPYLSGKAGFHFQATLNADPCNPELTFNLESILYTVVGLECDVLSLDYNDQWVLYSYPIGEWLLPLISTSTIIIVPEPDSIDAQWSIEGPCDFYENGENVDTLASLNPGEYTVTWEPVFGWISPPIESKNLEFEDTTIFSGIYIETDSVTDIDGNVYQAVKIGNQWWMAKNLKVTHYRNGDPIQHVTNYDEWVGLSTGAYCEYDNDPTNVEIYGRLYNWFAVNDSRNIAPEGWHVPTDEEWKQLEVTLGMDPSEAGTTGWRGIDEGGKLKEQGTSHWWSPNSGATNEFGFTALPGGDGQGGVGYYFNQGVAAYFWTSTPYITWAWSRTILYDNSGIYRNWGAKNVGISIRCIKD